MKPSLPLDQSDMSCALRLSENVMVLAMAPPLSRFVEATPDGELLGRAWFDQLKKHDDRIAGLARRLQAQGIRPNRSRRYRAQVAAFRGFLKTDIGRVLNRLD